MLTKEIFWIWMIFFLSLSAQHWITYYSLEGQIAEVKALMQEAK